MGLEDALQVTNDQGLLDVRYDAKPWGWNDEILALLASREAAPVLRELHLVGELEAGGDGVAEAGFEALVFGHELTNLEVFDLSPTCEGGVPLIGTLGGEQGTLGTLLVKAPALRVLISPSAPDASFFRVGERPIEELRIKAGEDHQGFIGNLARSSCFPRLRVVEWRDAYHEWRDGWSRYCTPAEDYLALFRSAVIARVDPLVLRDLYLTEAQLSELLAIWSEGVEIHRIHNPSSRP